jgi:hypothetical protein
MALFMADLFTLLSSPIGYTCFLSGSQREMTSYFAVPPDLCIISNLSPANYAACYLLCANFLLGLLVSPEDVGNMFLIYVG